MIEPPAPDGCVLTFGEALVGYSSPQPGLRRACTFDRFPGGADLNVAVGLGRLGKPGPAGQACSAMTSMATISSTSWPS